MAEDEKDPKQKLVVDEDWKAQVEKEKAAARAQQSQPDEPQPSEPTAAGEGSGEASSASQTREAGTAAEATTGPASAGPAGAAADRSAAGGADKAASGAAVPPASFSVLVSMLFTQAMAALGQIPDPATGKPSVDRAFAKHYIDTLAMLEEKTKDNLSSEEAGMLSEALHALRMTFVSTK